MLAKGHFQAFIDTIRQHGVEEKDLEILAGLKTALWAIGHIGASAGGLAFLEAEGVVDDIAGIAETSNVFSVRGSVGVFLSFSKIVGQLVPEWRWLMRFELVQDVLLCPRSNLFDTRRNRTSQ